MNMSLAQFRAKYQQATNGKVVVAEADYLIRERFRQYAKLESLLRTDIQIVATEDGTGTIHVMYRPVYDGGNHHPTG
jgi:hypothetical protein